MRGRKPASEPGARLPHHWLADGSSLYDQLGTGFSLVGPAGGQHQASIGRLAGQARRRGIPLALVDAPASYPWRTDFLLVRPDQHIAWRASDPARIDLDLVTARTLSS